MLKLAWHRRMLALTIATLPLGGCLTAAPKTVCGTVTELDKATQQKAGAELRALPADSVIGNVIVPDWQRQRDEARACAAKS